MQEGRWTSGKLGTRFHWGFCRSHRESSCPIGYCCSDWPVGPILMWTVLVKSIVPFGLSRTGTDLLLARDSRISIGSGSCGGRTPVRTDAVYWTVAFLFKGPVASLPFSRLPCCLQCRLLLLVWFIVIVLIQCGWVYRVASFSQHYYNNILCSINQFPCKFSFPAGSELVTNLHFLLRKQNIPGHRNC